MMIFNDPWKELRQSLYGNVEPKVSLVAMTQPIIRLNGDNVYYSSPEILPAISASISYGSTDTIETVWDKAINLNRNLIKKGHETPLESVTYNLYIRGISKSCGAQVSRHRIGTGHVSASSRYRAQEGQFVYPSLHKIADREQAKTIYEKMSGFFETSFQWYQELRKVDGLTKEEARRICPVAFSTERMQWFNARALRHFFKLRLALDAEWEIRRLATMIFNIVIEITPSLFEDLSDNIHKS